MTDPPTSNDDRLPWRQVPAVFAFQVAALTLTAWIFRHALNPDAVAYLQLASHYAHGRTDLAVSGFWGPLISWLTLPLLKLGMLPLGAARIVMSLSAIIFLCGCLRLFTRFNQSRSFLGWGLWISALVSILWSVENITPDLLLAGLVSIAFADMISSRWLLKPGVAFGSGLCWGLAFLCKVIALPLGVLTCVGVSLLWWRKRPDARRLVARSLGLATLGLALVAGPWIGVLSAHYGRFTVGTSARFNHSLVGPSVGKRLFLLDHGFHRPPAGRITVWEDPPLPYPAWSPVANWNNALHQLGIILRNLPVALFMLTGVSLAFPVLVILACLRRAGPGRSAENGLNIWWTMLPVLVLGGLYLPNYLLISEQRYFYPAFPFLWVAAAGLVAGAGTSTLSGNLPSPVLRTPSPIGWERGGVRVVVSDSAAHGAAGVRKILSWILRHGALLLAVAFLAPTLARSAWHLNSTRVAGECAHMLAQRIAAAQIAGPVAGSGRLPGGRAGLYVAFLLQQPWFGDKPSADATSFKRSGASLIIVNRGSATARELAADTEFINLDPQLFGPTIEAAQFPLQVFKSISPLEPGPRQK